MMMEKCVYLHDFQQINHIMADITIQVPESEYNSILRQAVAVIDKTRSIVATTITSAIGTAHWELGKLLHDKKLENKHGSGIVNRLSSDLKEHYPQMGMSPRNLWDMKKFYERFCDSDPKLRHHRASLPARHHLENLKCSSGGKCLFAEFSAVLYIDMAFSQVLRCNAVPL